jgi:hypothetical protein
MPIRPHGRAKVDRFRPSAWAVCDRCGFLYNHRDLRFQLDWAGVRLINKNILVCYRCEDEYQEQLRVFVLPPDPEPQPNPRPERYDVLDNPISPIGTPFGTMTQGGGLSAAFDSNQNKPFALCTATYTSTTNNTVGVNFSSSANAKTCASFTIVAPNNAPFLGSGTTTYTLQGSNAAFGFTTLATGNTAGTIGETITVAITPSGPYQYYQIVLGGDNVTSVASAQLIINQTG